LQLFIEEITDKPFASAMEELIIKPAGMQQSQFSIQLPDKMKANAAVGYFSIDKMVVNKPLPVYGPPSDLARFMLAVGDSYRGADSNTILKPSTAQEILQKIPAGGGLGLGIDGSGDSLRYRHSGGNAGFSCYAVAFANKGRGVIIMTNSNNGTALIREYLRSLSREYKWPPMYNRE
jgi:CubicO group peptidase (beta-lactamase class C family)